MKETLTAATEQIPNDCDTKPLNVLSVEKVSLSKLWINSLFSWEFLLHMLVEPLYFVSYRANLSNDYFTNRQDRYVLIEDCGPLADFYDDLVSRVSEFSLQLVKGGKVQLHPSWKWHPYKSRREEFESAARDRVWRLYRSAMSQQRSSGKSFPFDCYCLRIALLQQHKLQSSV